MRSRITPERILRLQAIAGNRAVQRLFEKPKHSMRDKLRRWWRFITRS